jgi:hypothetical protein
VKRILAHRPAPATVISCIALFVALGGVSYGVATGSIDSREIADNTVRSKDIRNNGVVSRDLRNNQVYGIDIRNNTIRARDVAPNTLTDDQIDESKLAQVPSALDAARLGGRAATDYAAKAEAVRLFGTAELAPGVTALGAGNLAPGFWKDDSGLVQLQGTVDGPADLVLTLPEGYRPAATARFAVATAAGATTVVTISAGGAVTAAGADASLDGISFRAAG